MATKNSMKDTWKVKFIYFILGALAFFGSLFFTVYLFCPACEDEQELVIEKAVDLAERLKERVIG